MQNLMDGDDQTTLFGYAFLNTDRLVIFVTIPVMVGNVVINEGPFLLVDRSLPSLW